MAQDIVFNDRVQPVTVSRTVIQGGETLRITGWGYTNHGGPILPNDLQELHVTAQTASTCKQYTPAATQLCTFLRPGQGVCNVSIAFQKYFVLFKCNNFSGANAKITIMLICFQGDSGSALLLNGQQVGIASYILNECAGGYPDYFTRLSLYNDWIDNIMNKY